ncbi:MAG: DUF3634 family protein [Polyangiaceae bacterium]
MSDLLIAAIALGAGLAALWFAARRDITVCVARVTDGKLTVVRGAIAPRILADLGDVVRRPRAGSAEIRILRDGGLAKVEITGSLTPAQVQQVRNVVGSVPLAKLANTRKN